MVYSIRAKGKSAEKSAVLRVAKTKTTKNKKIFVGVIHYNSEVAYNE